MAVERIKTKDSDICQVVWCPIYDYGSEGFSFESRRGHKVQLRLAFVFYLQDGGNFYADFLISIRLIIKTSVFV